MWKVFNHSGDVSLEQMSDDNCDQDIEFTKDSDEDLRIRCNDQTTAQYTSFSVPIDQLVHLMQELGYNVTKNSE